MEKTWTVINDRPDAPRRVPPRSRAIVRFLNPTALKQEGDSEKVQEMELDSDCASPLFTTIVSIHHVKFTHFPVLGYYYR